MLAYFDYFMQEYVWNFGFLSELDERQYIGEIVEKALGQRKFRKLARRYSENFQHYRRTFIQLIFESQKFLRSENHGEVSSAPASALKQQCLLWEARKFRLALVERCSRAQN